MYGSQGQGRVEPSFGRDVGRGPSVPATQQPGARDDARRMMLYNARSKSAVVAYLLWFFFGQLAVHRFYVGHVGIGLAWLGLLFVSFVLTVVYIGLLGFMILGLWWLVDGIRLAGMVRRHNERVAYEL